MPSPSTSSAPLPLDQRVQDELLFVGYRKEIKGIDTLLEAFAIVVAARPAARLRLIGGSPTGGSRGALEGPSRLALTLPIGCRSRAS